MQQGQLDLAASFEKSGDIRTKMACALEQASLRAALDAAVIDGEQDRLAQLAGVARGAA